jgi:ABC-type transport system involved in multi-copper enzyme maturation permease subunit
MIVTPYESRLADGRYGFTTLLRAEWTKFRTVRGWVIGMLVAALAIVAFGVMQGRQGSCDVAACTVPLGPGGEPVTDSFYFVHQPLAGNGSISARVTSLTGEIPAASGPGMRGGLMPWAKAGIILKASTAQGSAYVAIMVTGSHGVRMQYDYTGDIAGPAAGAPHWLRLTRSGDTITGYSSADGTRWARVGSVRLAGLPSTVQGGLFTTSPQYVQTSLGEASMEGGPSQATGVFDDVGLTWPGGAWAGYNVGGGGAGNAGGFSQAAGTFTVTGNGDIAPATDGGAGFGTTIAQTLAGVFAGLIVVVVIGAMFMTAEYRRGLIRVTLAASPARGRVLAAKALVVGAVTFAAGLAGAGVAVVFGQRILRDNGAYVYPASALTEVRVIVGTAAVLAVAAVIALAIGAALRRSAGAVAVVIVVIVLPYMLTVAAPILPLGPNDWLLRVTPAAAFAVEQTLVQYPQVNDVYTAANGYYPLAPWAGFGVLCAWAALALGVAIFLLRRRDA